MHSADQDSGKMLAGLSAERATHPGPTAATATPVAELDPETAAIRYLHQALASAAVPAFSAPKAAGVESGFRRLGTQPVPLTGTFVVKFRQTYDDIPVYGSLVSIELDAHNGLVGLNASLGEPKGVDPVAGISPATALKKIRGHGGYRKQLERTVPRLCYYFDARASARTWRLVYIAEDVPVQRAKAGKSRAKPAPQFMDYVVDAHSGKVIAELPRTPSFATTTATTTATTPATGIDGLKKVREFGVELHGRKQLLRNRQLNVQTFDFQFLDPQVQASRLPGRAIANPPDPWPPAAVSAHANAESVATFLRDVLRRDGIDNRGGAMNSSINCVVQSESTDGKQWFNAFWNGAQMVYGQRKEGLDLMSLAVDLDVVGHEMFHGVTEATARLEYVEQSGALNESYSDIFGVIIANFDTPHAADWRWEVGEGLSPDGKAFRDLAHPARFGQPEQMAQYRRLPDTERGDWGGVHTNSGIHNRAAFLMLTAKGAAGQPALTPREVAAVFYLALTQQLSRTSQFSDSRRGVMLAARSLFRTLAPADRDLKLGAVANAFRVVGIMANDAASDAPAAPAGSRRQGRPAARRSPPLHAPVSGRR
jgi:bacillolysin/neutral peptidase B